jgi:DNA-directed RNA polymerase specialized sigma24 family protein
VVDENQPRLAKEEEHQLIRQAVVGSRRAFDRLKSAYYLAVRGYISPRSRNEEDTDEISDGTWKRVRSSLASYDDKFAFFTFVRLYATRELIDFYRRRKRFDHLFILMSDLIARYPKLVDDPDVAEMVDRMTADPYVGVVVTIEDCRWLLQTTFSRGGYPWELTGFGFVKLLKGWKPASVAAELSDDKLQLLGKTLERGFNKATRIDDDDVHCCFQPYQQSMKLAVEETLEPGRQAPEGVLAGLLDVPVGTTTMHHYYGRNRKPAAIVSDWIYNVRQAVFEEALKAGFPLARRIANGDEGRN